MVIFLLRLFFCILLLIVCSLVSSGFGLGGRWSILLTALLIVGTGFGVRRVLRIVKIPSKYQAWLSEIGILGVVIAFGRLFFGVNLSWLGIITVYLGMVGLEMILPEQSSQGFFRPNKQN